MSLLALSQSITKLERRLGVPPLARNSRTVGLTQGGARLFTVLRPRLDEIATEVAALTDQPGGHLRITASEHAALMVLQPALARLRAAHPWVTVAVSVDLGLTDSVAERFDAGIRLGEHLAQDRISPPLRMAGVAASACLARRPRPQDPRRPARPPRHGTLAQWEFENTGRVANVRGNPTFVTNSLHLGLVAAREGLAWMPACGGGPPGPGAGCPGFPAHHLYSPAAPSSALAELVATQPVRR